MFERRESSRYIITVRRKFENRTWNKEESFHEYLHGKIIMGYRVPVDEVELFEHITDGIPDIALRDQARLQGLHQPIHFGKITLRDRNACDQLGST